jgi:hypothetical protein
MGGFASCLLVVFLCSLLISGCGGGVQEQLKEHGGTCYGLKHGMDDEQINRRRRQYNTFQNPECVCPTNNTCTWAYDEVCDDASGVCEEGTDCEDCGTCNWYRCVSKAEVPKPTTLDKCENWTQVQLPTPPPTPCQCLNTCAFANNAVCQDGGPGSVYPPACGSGTDCGDCGDRCR